MAQYDGSIRINTEIDSKNASAQLMALENRIVKTADKIASLRSKMDSLKDAKIPTQEYKDISDQIAKAETEFNKLLEKQEQMQREGKDNGVTWDRLNAKMEEVGKTIRYAKGELQDLIDTGKAFTIGGDTEQYSNLGRQLQYAENEMSVLNQRHNELVEKQNKTSDSYKKIADTAKKAFKTVGDVLKKANSTVNNFGKRIKEAFSKFTKSASSATKSENGFAVSLKNILKYGFGIRSLYALVNKLRSGMKEGFANLLTYSQSLENSVNGIKASALTLKNAFAAAFSPFVEIALPYVQKLLDYMIRLANVAGQFFAAITGRKTYIKAIKQTTDALKEETKEMNKQLSTLDNLNNLSSQKDKGKDDSAGGTMFEEVPIDKSVLDMAEKVKDILSKLFAPLKEAWERDGKFVMDSWKYALDEVWKLIKDIGRDFLTVWQQEATIKIFEDLLHIIGDIGLVIGHLARNFREAWNENETGLRILENIRDIIGVIISNIREAADKTVEWADKLNFKPLLEAFERFTRSLIPLADALSGILEDFYTKVLLPLAKWTIEKGLPELLDVFTAFNEKVDWQALRKNLAEFWEHLEPFAETIGEGLIIFIQRVSDALADFLNSQEFKDFLVMLEDWMDSVSPEDVADALELIAKGLIALKLAVLGFGAISAVAGVFTTLSTFFSAIGSFGGLVVKGASLIATGIGNIIAAIGGLLPALAVVTAAVGGWKIGEWINEKLLGIDTPSFHEMMEGIKSSFTDGSWKEALRLWGEDIKSSWIEIWGYVKEDFNNSILGELLGSFTDGTWRDALRLWGNDIYSAFVTLGERQSEWLNSLRTKWLQTWNGIKSGIFNVINSIKSTVGSVLDWIGSKLKSLQSAFSGIGNKASGLFGGRSTSGTASYSTQSATPYAANPAFAALSTTPIPKLATGAVIPANKEFLAILGDQKSGTNVEAPLSTIEEAVINAMAKVNNSMGNNGGGTVTVEIPVIIKGIGEIGRAVQQFDREFFKQNGRHAFT